MPTFLHNYQSRKIKLLLRAEALIGSRIRAGGRPRKGDVTLLLQLIPGNTFGQPEPQREANRLAQRSPPDA